MVNAGHFEVGATLAGLVTVYQQFNIWRSKRMHRENKEMLGKLLSRLVIEHEMLVEEYCERNGLKREDLPTRHPTILDKEYH
jgi:hypothetical protein